MNDEFLACPSSEPANSGWEIEATINMSNGLKGYRCWAKEVLSIPISFAFTKITPLKFQIF